MFANRTPMGWNSTAGSKPCRSAEEVIPRERNSASEIVVIEIGTFCRSSCTFLSRDHNLLKLARRVVCALLRRLSFCRVSSKCPQQRQPRRGLPEQRQLFLVLRARQAAAKRLKIQT